MTKNPEILYQCVPFFCCLAGFTAHLDRMTDLSVGNLVETAKKLSKVRTHYKEWYKIAIPMLLIWVGWMVYEMVNAIGIESPTVIEPAILDWVVSFIIFASFQSKIALYL